MTKKRFVVGQIKEEVPESFEDSTEESDEILFSENLSLDDVVNLIEDEVEQPIEGTSDSTQVDVQPSTSSSQEPWKLVKIKEEPLIQEPNKGSADSSKNDVQPSTSSSDAPWNLVKIKEEPLDEEEVLQPEHQVPSQSTEQPMELVVETKEAKETSPSESQSPGADSAVEFIGQRFEGTATFVVSNATGIRDARKFLKKMSGKLELAEILESGGPTFWEQREIVEGLKFLMEKRKQVPKKIKIKEEVDDGIQTPSPGKQKITFVSASIFADTPTYECDKKGIAEARKFLNFKASALCDKSAMHDKLDEEEDGPFGLFKAVFEDPTSEDLDLIEEAIRCLRIAKDRFGAVANLNAEPVDRSEMEDGGQMEMREEEYEEDEPETNSDAETENSTESPETPSTVKAEASQEDSQGNVVEGISESDPVKMEEVVMEDVVMEKVGVVKVTVEEHRVVEKVAVEKNRQQPTKNVWDRITFPNNCDSGCGDWDYGHHSNILSSAGQPDSIPEKNRRSIQERISWPFEYKYQLSDEQREKRREKRKKYWERRHAREEEMRQEQESRRNYEKDDELPDENPVLHVTVPTPQDYHHPIHPPPNHRAYHRPAHYNPYSRPPPHYCQGYRQGYRQAPTPAPSGQWNARTRIVVPESKNPTRPGSNGFRWSNQTRVDSVSFGFLRG